MPAQTGIRKTYEAFKNTQNVRLLMCFEWLQPGAQAASEAAKPTPFCRECHSHTLLSVLTGQTLA